MTLETEALIDRRRLTRRITVWRILAAFLAVALIGALTSLSTSTSKLLGSDAFLGEPAQIARVTITGVITDDRKQQELLRKLAKKDHVKAVILRINSPGGTTTGGEALYYAIRDISAKKPVVAVFGTVAASAAYMAGIATDHIVARANTITGSVGVIFQWAEISGLLKNYGVKFEEVKSGKLKATPSPFQPVDEAGRSVARDVVQDGFSWFINLVAARRKLQPEDVPGLKEGRIFSGRQALRHKLVDEIGGEKAAKSWLEKKRDIETDLPVKDWEQADESRFDLLTGMVRVIGGIFGLSRQKLDLFLTASHINSRQHLDGMLSVWQPATMLGNNR